MTDYGTCKKCGTPLVLAPGIDTYCPNEGCKVDLREMMRPYRERRAKLESDYRAWLTELVASGDPKAELLQRMIDKIEHREVFTIQLDD